MTSRVTVPFSFVSPGHVEEVGMTVANANAFSRKISKDFKLELISFGSNLTWPRSHKKYLYTVF